jgi:hypothetical protein
MPQILPQFQHLIPPPTAEELARLEASLKEEGCREPLIVWDCGLTPENAVLVDGHNRLAICEAHSIEYRLHFRCWNDENAVKLWIINNQLARRNLSDFAKGELALRSKTIIADIAKENQRFSGKKDNGDEGLTILSNLENGTINTRERLAEIAGVSEGTIHKIEKITQYGTDELVAMTRAGDLSINAAYKIADNPPESQADILRGILEGASPSQIPSPKKTPFRDPEDDGYTQADYEQVVLEMGYKLDALIAEARLDIEKTLLRCGEHQPLAADRSAAITKILQKVADEGWPQALLEHLRVEHRGTALYFSTNTHAETAEKRAAYRAEFNGENRAALCAKYAISKRTSFRWTTETKTEQELQA